MTSGKTGLDVHAVAESTRITLDRQLHAFRDDEVGFHVLFFFFFTVVTVSIFKIFKVFKMIFDVVSVFRRFRRLRLCPGYRRCFKNDFLRFFSSRLMCS